MNQDLMIANLSKKYNGTITRKQLSNQGLSSYNVSQLVKDGILERTRPGIYIDTNGTEDIFYSMQQKYKKGIFSLETALYLWNLSDQYPFNLDMTFPRGYNNNNLDPEILPHIQAKSLFSEGITETDSFNGNKIRLYSKERTLAEILRPINSVDIEIITNAYKAWSHAQRKNINELMNFAQKFKVAKKVNSYLEILL